MSRADTSQKTFLTVVWPALNAFISGETVGAKHEGKIFILLHNYGERFLTAMKIGSLSRFVSHRVTYEACRDITFYALFVHTSSVFSIRCNLPVLPIRIVRLHSTLIILCADSRVLSVSRLREYRFPCHFQTLLMLSHCTLYSVTDKSPTSFFN